MKQSSLLLSISIALILVFTACDSGTGAEGDNGTGTVEVSLADAPADYDSVNVTINSISMNSNGNADSSESEESAGWVTIMDEPMKVNLLELSNGNTIMLGSKELETGNYSQLRLTLGDDNTVAIDGESYELITPSGQQTGIKLNIDANVEASSTYSLLIDFDAAHSVIHESNLNFILRPIVRAVNLAETGSVAGIVQPADFKTNVLAVSEGDTIASTITSDNGDFKILGLSPGSYDIVLDPSSEDYGKSQKTDVEVTQGEENDIGTMDLN